MSSASKQSRPASLLHPTNEVISISLGSSSLRYGLSDAIHAEPRSMPMVVAYRRTTAAAKPPVGEGGPEIKSDSLLPRSAAADDGHAELAEQRAARARSCDALAKLTQKQRKFSELHAIGAASKVAAVPVFDEKNSSVVDAHDKPVYTDVSSRPAHLTGERALHISPSEPYQLVFPIRRGTFAITEQQPLALIVDSLEVILRAAVESLKVPSRFFSSFSVSLSLPDSFSEREAMELVNVLLARLRFRDVLVHKESVLTCLGAGLVNACVVDVGAQKTHVACIQDGVLVPRTSVLLPYGGDDVVAVFLWLLKRLSGSEHYFPFAAADLSIAQDRMQLEALCRTACHFVGLNYDMQQGELRERRPPAPTVLHRFNFSTAAVLAPVCLFEPALLDPESESDAASGPGPSWVLRSEYYDRAARFDVLAAQFLDKSPSVTFTSQYLELDEDQRSAVRSRAGLPPQSSGAGAGAGSATATGAGASSGAGAGAGPVETKTIPLEPASQQGSKRPFAALHNADAPAQAPGEPPLKKARLDGPLSRMPLHEAIASSIGNLDAALKPRFASQILLAGGTSQLRGLVHELELRGKYELGQVGVAPDSVSVLLNQKRIDSRNLSWKGATVFAATESSRGMWISRAEWQLHGLPLLRMRVPFAW